MDVHVLLRLEQVSSLISMSLEHIIGVALHDAHTTMSFFEIGPAPRLVVEVQVDVLLV